MNERTTVPLSSRVVRLIVIALAGVIGFGALGSGVAHAANTVVSSDPADGSTIADSPKAISITFTEELGETNTIALNCNGELYTVGPREVSNNRLTLTATIVDALPKGTCVAQWVVSNSDGGANGQGNITFTVQNAPATTPTTDSSATTVAPSTGDSNGSGDTTTGTDDSTTGTDDAVSALNAAEEGKGPLWLGRVLSTLGLAVLFGSLVLIAAAWPEGVEYLLAIRFLRTTWIVALLGTLLYVAAASSAVTGDGLGAGLNPTGWLELFDAGLPGIAAVGRLVLVAGSAYVAFRPDRVIDPVTQMAGLGIPALAVATVGLSRTDMDLAIIGVPIAIVHALAMAVWFGGVVLLARVVLAGPGEEDLVHAVRGFTRVSTPAIALTVLSGLIQMVLLDGSNLFGSSHGRVLLLKTVAVAAMIFIAISARQFVTQRLARADEMSIPMADRLRRAFGIEALTGVLVLALSGWLLALSPPNVAAGSSIAYRITVPFEAPEFDLDVTVRLTTDRVGVAGMEVAVDAPESGLSGLEVVLTSPPNENHGGYIQPVPLTGRGVAVRAADAGFPLTVAGTWTVEVNAVTANGTFNSEPKAFTILNADGTAVSAPLTVPPPAVITTIPD